MAKHTKPFPYQKEGALLIEQFGGRALLADTMGLGKSLTSLLWAHRNPDVRPIVIVCPASLKFNWEREASRHFGMSAEILNGTKPTKLGLTASHQIVIINYDILHCWLPFLKALKPKLIICDEVHYAKSLRSRRTKALHRLCKGVPHVIALSGTPLTNRPAELWPTLHLLRPKKFHAFFPFAQKYCSPELTPWGWRYNGATNLGALHKRLKRLLMIRRTKKQVIEQLPAKLRFVVPFELSDRKEYDHALKDFIGWLNQYNPAKANKAARAERLVKWGYLKRLAAQLKMKSVLDWIDNFLEESGGKLIVFAVHKDIVAQLYGRYKKIAVKVDGSVKNTDRRLAVDSFQHNKKVRLFIGNIQAAGVGLTLTAAETVAFVELSWTPGEHAQCEDRCIAKGQRVHTDKGFVEIENVQVGDKVLTHLGNWKKVVDKFSKQAPDTVLVKYTRYPTGLQCTSDHRVWCKDKNGLIGWKEAGLLEKGDFVGLPRMRKCVHSEELVFPKDLQVYSDADLKKWSVCLDCDRKPWSNNLCVRCLARRKRKGLEVKTVGGRNGRYKKLPKSVPLTDDVLRLFGRYIADGCVGFSKDSGYARCIGIAGNAKTEMDSLRYYKNILDKSFGVCSSIHVSKTTNTAELICYSRELGEWFLRLFIPDLGNDIKGKGRFAVVKRIPFGFLHLSKEQSMSLLNGIMEGDGCHYTREGCDSRCIGIVSPSLAAQIALLVSKCGYNPSFRVEKKRPVGCRTVWVVTWTERPPVKLRHDLRQSDDIMVWNPVESVTSVGSSEVYDLSVDKDHSFVVGQSAVHNCYGRVNDMHGANIYYLIAQNTVEEKLVELIHKKQKVLDQVLDGKKSSGFNLMDLLEAELLKQTTLLPNKRSKK